MVAAPCPLDDEYLHVLREVERGSREVVTEQRNQEIREERFTLSLFRRCLPS